MNFKNEEGFKSSSHAILFLQFIAILVILFDVPLVRQIIGFIYFTFISGFILVKLLKLELSKLEVVLFSVGLSIAFLMITGLLINEIGLFFGFPQPLSLFPLMIGLNGFIFLSEVLVYLRKGNLNLPSVNLEKKYIFILPLLSIPIISIIGAIYAGTYGNNTLLLIMIILTSLAFAITAVLENISLRKLYPIVILFFALALLYQGTLISNRPISYGSDLGFELFTFKNTLNNERWASGNLYGDTQYGGRFQSMLSITILPTIYSKLLNLEPDWVFKILYPLIFAFVPLGIYAIWKEKFGNRRAFVSAFLFLANAIFYTEVFGLTRQMIAELFFVLLLYVILNNSMKTYSRITCFIIFSFALIVSHYGIAEVFMMFISLVLVLLIVIKKSHSRKITLSMCLLFFVLMFSWYIYTANAATFETFVEYGDYVYRSLRDIFSLEARESTVLRGLGLEAPPTVWNALSRGFQYAIEFLIVAGFIGLFLNMKRIKATLDNESFMLFLVAMIFLGMLIVVPGLSKTMTMSRFFHVLLIIISPLSVIGAEFLASFFKRNKEFLVSMLLISIMVPYFLFQSGFVYEVVGNDTWCLPLSAYRMPAYRSRGQLGLVDERDIICALWLKTNLDVRGRTVYADNPSVRYMLLAYSMILTNRIVLNNVTVIANNSFIYLSRLNTVDNMVVGTKFIWNTTDFPFPDDLSLIYTNGASEIRVK